MEPKNYKINKITRFILPFILPDKKFLSEEFGFINAYSKKVLNHITIVLVFKHNLNIHNTLRKYFKAMLNYKVSFSDFDYDLFELTIPNENKLLVENILDNNVYGILSECKLKILKFWNNLEIVYVRELLKDLLEVDVLEIKGIYEEIPLSLDITNKT